MFDRENVIKGLEEISDYFFDIYRNDTDSYKCENAQEYSDVAIDAIALLKDYNVLERQYEISNELLKLNRRTGKWIEEEPNCYTKKTYCSVCKEPAPFIAVGGDYYGRNMHGKTEKTKYCPNCGARMTLLIIGGAG